MKISIIGAMGKHRELGFGNKLLWHLPDDLKRFKEITRGHVVIMGRKTYESIGRALPDRKNIIVTRNPAYQAPGCVVVGSIEDAFKAATKNHDSNHDHDDEIFVIGGGDIYKLALPYINTMYLTFVDAELPADAFFPEFDESEWRVVREEVHETDEKHTYRFIFRVYESIN